MDLIEPIKAHPYYKDAERGGPGGAILIDLKGETKSLYFGSADVETSSPIGHATSFHVASLAKQFTAFAILILAESGIVDLDQPASDWIRELRYPLNSIKLSELLYHTSGLRDQWVLSNLTGQRAGSIVLTDMVLAITYKETALNFPSGTKFQYSNTGYTVLSEIIRRASGVQFDQFMKERVFTSLGLNSSFFVSHPFDAIKNRAVGYAARTGDGQLYRRSDPPYGVFGSTCLRTSPADMMRWLTCLRDKTYFSSDLYDLFTRPGSLKDGTAIPYGFGQISSIRNGIEVISHSGWDYGFNAALFRSKDGLHGLFGCSNGSFGDLETICTGIFDRAMSGDLDTHRAQVKPPVTPALRKPIPFPTDEYIEVFANEDLTDVRALRYVDGKTLTLDWMQGFELSLSGDNYYCVRGTSAWLWREELGDQTVLQFYNLGSQLTLASYRGLPKLDASSLAGVYFNPTLNTALTIRFNAENDLVEVIIGASDPECIFFASRHLLMWRGYWGIAEWSDDRLTSIKVCHPRSLNVEFKRTHVC